MAKSRGLKQDEVDKEALELVKKHMFEGEMCYDLKSEDKYRKDLVSHHILRLAFCSSEDKRRQFADAETALFRARFLKLQADQKSFFMKQNILSLEVVSPTELMAHKDALRQVYYAHGADDERGEARLSKEEEETEFLRLTFFKVPYLQVIDLVRSRRIYVHEGVAFVPERRLVNIVVNRFKAYMKATLVMANKALPPLLADERINPILKSMADAYTGPDFNGKKGAVGDVRPENIEALGGTSFALCMSNLQDALKAKSHLKHWGRQQYGLFLKGIGLTLEDSLAFWQKHFTRKMSPEEFLKKYASNIRCVEVLRRVGRARRRARVANSGDSPRPLLPPRPPPLFSRAGTTTARRESAPTTRRFRARASSWAPRPAQTTTTGARSGTGTRRGCARTSRGSRLRPRSSTRF
jgi:DNA primase large subunit